MKAIKSPVHLMIELSFLALLILGLVFLMRNLRSGNLANLEGTSTEIPPYPPPGDTEATPIDELIPTEPIPYPPPREIEVIPTEEIPTELPPPPFPTPLPTPLVTPIPVAEPPVISDVVGKTEQPFWIYFWQGNEVWRIDDQGLEKQFVFDTYKNLGQWLTGHPRPNSDCCWVGERVVISPDGRKLALIVVDKIDISTKGESFTFSIFIYDTLTGEVKLLGEGVQPVWSPDSQRITYLNEGKLWIGELDSGQVSKIAEGDPSIPEHDIRRMAWSPDGNYISYLVTRSMMYPELKLINLLNPETHRSLLPETLYTIGNMGWSLDGQYLLYTSWEGEGSGPDHVDNLWTLSVADGSRKQITRDMTVMHFDLSPDGKWLSISATIHYERELYLYDIWLASIQGDQLIRVTKASPEDFLAYWSPDGTRLIFYREGSGLVVFSLEKGTITQLGIDPGSNFAIGGLK